MEMKKTKNERRQTLRRDIRTRVRLRSRRAGSYENAHLVNLGRGGLYLMTRSKLKMGEQVDIAVPSETDDDHIKIKVKVMRQGDHRWWGLFSYGCRLLRAS